MRKQYWITLLFMALLLLSALVSPIALPAQMQGSLLILPFTGSQPDHARELAISFGYIGVLMQDIDDLQYINQRMWEIWRNVFAKIGVLLPDSFPDQMDISNSIDIGFELDATHVITGHITTIGGRNIVLLSLIDLYTQQLISGYYKQYTRFEELNIIEIASQFAKSASVDTNSFPGLVVPFPVIRSGNPEEQALLTQVLCYELANSERFAIFPMDYDMTRRYFTEEFYFDELIMLISIKSKRTTTTFTVDIYDMELYHLDYAEKTYSNFAEGLVRMPRLAQELIERIME